MTCLRELGVLASTAIAVAAVPGSCAPENAYRTETQYVIYEPFPDSAQLQMNLGSTQAGIEYIEQPDGC